MLALFLHLNRFGPQVQQMAPDIRLPHLLQLMGSQLAAIVQLYKGFSAHLDITREAGIVVKDSASDVMSEMRSQKSHL